MGIIQKKIEWSLNVRILMTLRYTYMKPSNGTLSPSRAKKRNEDIFPLWKGMKSRVGDDMMQKMPFSNILNFPSYY